MIDMPSAWPTVLACMAAAVLVSPLLAAWTATGPAPGTHGVPWWRPRRVSPRRLLTVAATAAVLATLAARAVPVPAWWIFAAGGAVLAVIDAEHHLLQARIVYPLGATLFVALVLSAFVTGELDRLIRAVLAVAAVGAVWFVIAFLSPGSMGLGDVRMAALTAGMLGWIGWSAVLTGQLVTIGLALATAGVIALTGSGSTRAAQVPLGPAFVLGTLLAATL
jgi:leader peptidase (prepilin peptidase)/N-methyltransferase